MARLQLVDGADAKQAHRAPDLVGQDADGAGDATASTGHEAVEIGPSVQSEAGAEGERGDDVGAVHDAGVQVHLEVAAHLTNNVGQQVEGNRRPVKLPPAVVGDHDRVDGQVGEALGVLDR